MGRYKMWMGRTPVKVGIWIELPVSTTLDEARRAAWRLGLSTRHYDSKSHRIKLFPMTTWRA